MFCITNHYRAGRLKIPTCRAGPIRACLSAAARLLFWMQLASKPPPLAKVLVRATNWLGDAVMSLPAIRAIREAFSRGAHCSGGAPWVADLYARESSIDRVIPYPKPKRPPRAGASSPRVCGGAVRRRHPSAKRLRRSADGLDGAHSGAHRLQPRRPRSAAHPRHPRSGVRRDPAP